VLGLAGCVSPPSRSTASGANDFAEGVQRRVSLDGQDTIPAELDLRVEATIREPTVTDSHTARIGVAVTNEGPERGLAVSTDRCALFNRYSQTSQPRGIWLGFAEDPVYATRRGPQWIARPPENGAFPDYGCSRRTYAHGESVEVEYALYHDDRTDGYLDAGTYRFAEDGVRITSSASTESGSEAPTTFSWGFSVDVANPNCTLCF
jgi:hypothetical protein